MRVAFLIGLLAVSAAAYSDYARNVPFDDGHLFGRFGNLTDILKQLSEASPTTLPPFPLPPGTTNLRTELDEFGRKLVGYTLNLNNYHDCTKYIPNQCFPLNVQSLDDTNLIAIKYLMKYLYGAEYDRILNYEFEGDSKAPPGYSHYRVQDEMRTGYEEIMKTWNEVWSSLEQKSFKDMFQREVWQIQGFVENFFQVNGPKRALQAQERYRKVFARALNKTVAEQSLSRALKQFERYEQRRAVRNLFDGDNTILDISEFPNDISNMINILHCYIYKADSSYGQWHMGHYIDKITRSSLSRRTLFVFRFYLEDIFGEVLKEIPVQGLAVESARREKYQTITSLRDMMKTTLEIWYTNFEYLLVGDYKDDKKREGFENAYKEITSVMLQTLSVEELHQAYRRALPILGWVRKGFVTTTTTTTAPPPEEE